MGKIKNCLEQKKCVSVFFTAGYPAKNNFRETILQLQNSGIDFIEIGIPFSDPVADGDTIQKSSMQAIQNGANLDFIFTELNFLHNEISVPLVLMGYFNSIYSYGIKRFLENCKSVGIETVIIPDLSPEIYESEYLHLFKEVKVNPVFIITPQTNFDRILKIDALSNEFIYVLSTFSITGNKNLKLIDQREWLERMSNYNLKNKLVLGFGVRTANDIQFAHQYLDGVIVGSAFIESQTDKKSEEFIKGLVSISSF